MQQAMQARELEYLEQFSDELYSCSDSQSFDSCLVDVGRSIYQHNGWNLEELASSGLNNPLSPESDEVSIMAIPIIANSHDPVNSKFLVDIGLDIDTKHWSNFEPAFLDSLKQTYPDEYRQAIAWAMSNDEVREYREEMVGDLLQDFLESPYLDMYSKMYFGTHE
jgi:hypothetical protein